MKTECTFRSVQNGRSANFGIRVQVDRNLQIMTNLELRINMDYFQDYIAYMLKIAKKESSVVHCD